MSTVRARLGAAAIASFLAVLGLGSAFTATAVTNSVGLQPEPTREPAPVAVAGDDAEAEVRALQLTARAARAARSSVSSAAGAATPPGPAVTAKKTARPAPPAAAAKKTTKTAAKTKVPARRSEAAPVAAPAAAGRAQVVIAYALAQVGKPYRFGAAGPSSFDCSGLVLQAYARVGVSLPHKANGIAGLGRSVARASWQPGDVLAWRNGSTYGHVAIYLGAGKMVHASRAGVPVKVASVYGAPIGRRLL